jgi:hypothetical protein
MNTTFKPADLMQDNQHFGEFGGVNPSISDSATYTFLHAQTMMDTFEGKQGDAIYILDTQVQVICISVKLWRRWREQKMPM